MNYTKPQVADLGQAARVIESNPNIKVAPNFPDGKQLPALPAYDLDE